MRRESTVPTIGVAFGELGRRFRDVLRRWIRFAGVSLVLAVVGCTSPQAGEEPALAVVTTSDTSVPSTGGSPSTSQPAAASPPLLLLRSADQSVQPAMLGYCWSADGEGFCAEFVSSDGPVVSANEPIVIDFPLKSWEFADTTDPNCSSAVIDVGRGDTGKWTIEVSGPEGLHPVRFQGEGPEGSADYRFIAATTAVSGSDSPGITPDPARSTTCDSE